MSGVLDFSADVCGQSPEPVLLFARDAARWCTVLFPELEGVANLAKTLDLLGDFFSIPNGIDSVGDLASKSWTCATDLSLWNVRQVTVAASSVVACATQALGFAHEIGVINLAASASSVVATSALTAAYLFASLAYDNWRMWDELDDMSTRNWREIETTVVQPTLACLTADEASTLVGNVDFRIRVKFVENTAKTLLCALFFANIAFAAAISSTALLALSTFSLTSRGVAEYCGHSIKVQLDRLYGKEYHPVKQALLKKAGV